MDYWTALLYLASAICLGSLALHVAVVGVLLYGADILVYLWWLELSGTASHRIPNPLLKVGRPPGWHILSQTFSFVSNSMEHLPC